MINEIAGKLDVREEVKNFRIKHQPIKLKAGDKVFIRGDLEDEKEYSGGHYFFADSMKTGECTVRDVCGEYIEIVEDGINAYSNDMIDWEQTATLNATKTSSFDDLVDKTIKAVRDYVAIITHLELDNITIESINYDLLSPLEIYREDAPEKIQKAIDWIDSLYTETFVIESEEDIKKIRDGAGIVLANSERGTFNVISGLMSITNEKTGTEVMGLNIFWLKGATVTQKKEAM